MCRGCQLVKKPAPPFMHHLHDMTCRLYVFYIDYVMYILRIGSTCNAERGCLLPEGAKNHDPDDLAHRPCPPHA